MGSSRRDREGVRRVRHIRWHDGERVSSGEMNECSCCNKRRKLRSVGDVGYVCHYCYVHGDRCSRNGCDEPAVKGSGGVCRSHYMDLEYDDVTIESMGGWVSSPSSWVLES